MGVVCARAGPPVGPLCSLYPRLLLTPFVYTLTSTFLPILSRLPNPPILSIFSSLSLSPSPFPSLPSPGNVDADDAGVAKVHLEDQFVKLIGPQSIIGRSMVICMREDDLGKGGHELSLIDGNAGPAVAVAVVGITD